MKRNLFFILLLVSGLESVAQHNLDPVLNAPGLFPKQKEQFLLNQGSRIVPIPLNSEAADVKDWNNTISSGTKQDSYRSPQFDPTWAARFQTVLDSVRIVNSMKGASLAVFVPGQGLITCVTGISSPGVPVTTAMRFGIMSNTKLFVATTLAKLQEQGILSLDDPLYQWIPTYRNVDSTTTIRQLLSHESGIWDYWNDGDSLWNQIWVDTTKFWLPEEMLDYIKAPHFPPGHGYSYSNTNFLLAGMVIEAATGTSWLQKIHDFIINPLNMDSTFAGAYEPRNGPVAAEYLNNTPAVLSPITAEFTQGNAAAALLSTAQEMAEWYSSLFNGAVVSESSLQQITNFDPTTWYGLGLGLSLYKHHVAFNHTGGGAGYLSLAWYDAVTHSALVLLMNDRNSGDFNTRAIPLIDVLLDEYPRKTNDAGITGIIAPWEHSCSTTRTPSVLLTNSGSATLTSVSVNYQVDAGAPASYAWTGSLNQDDTVQVNLPMITSGNGYHIFTCYTTLPNGSPDGYNYNDTARSNFISDLLPPAISVINESFESPVFPPQGWVQNANSILAWGPTPLAQFSGSKAAVLNNYWNDMNSHYDLYLPMIRVAGGTHPSLEFEYAYAMYPNYYGDSLQVYISRDCGTTWQMIFNKGGITLATSATTYNNFYPQSADEWQHESSSLESDTGNILIRFRDVCGWGNNLYLDDVRVSFPTGTADMGLQNAILVYPNPATDRITISGLPVNAEIQITDLTGKLLVTTKASTNLTTIDISRFPQGVYVLRSAQVVKKIVKM
jgi:CubicO group peptidase (beta-lactamase class C family)